MRQSYRQTYHANVPAGWANDPNGTIFYRGQAHLFFQHYPHKPQWGTMHWGHFVTNDFVHWKTLPIALEPDRDYEVLCGCCSGSAIEKDGKLYLMYTAAQPELQRQCIAVSEDGVHFEKDPGNPIITAEMLSPEVSPLDFRDPRMFRRNGVYYLIAGARVIDPGAEARAAGGSAAPSQGKETSFAREARSPSIGDVSGTDPEIAGYGNMVLLRVAGTADGAQRIFEGMKARGVLVKHVSAMHPQLVGCLRLTVGNADENTHMLAALRAALQTP